jgi:hypothetical protein
VISGRYKPKCENVMYDDMSCSMKVIYREGLGGLVIVLHFFIPFLKQ